jgi:uncharacterized protein YjeT (DUF2065 family)
MEYFLYVLGMVLVVEGLPYFGFPHQIKELAKRVPDMEDSSLRGLGLTLILAGLGILYLTSYLWSS